MGQRTVPRRREPHVSKPARFLRLRRCRWLVMRRISIAWSYMWAHGSFTRRFCTVVILGLAVYAVIYELAAR